MNDVKKAFDHIDVTEDGYVSNVNFKEVVNKLGMTEYMTPEAEKNAMHMFTTDSAESKAGFINFEGENDALFCSITQDFLSFFFSFSFSFSFSDYTLTTFLSNTFLFLLCSFFLSHSNHIHVL